MRFRGLAWAALSTLLTAALMSQQQATPPQTTAPLQQQAPFVATVNSVSLVFPIVDKKNHFVPGIRQDQIQVFDNNQLQKIQHFDSLGDLPLRILLLLDVSNSIRTRWDFEQRAALDFLHSVLVEGRDKAMVVGFDTNIHVATPFTDNFDQLTMGVRKLSPSGGTALYDALFTTAHDYLGANNSGEVRNVIIIITDGEDDQSRYSRDESLEMAQQVGAVIYSIGTEPTGSDPKSDHDLQLYASQTGGLSFFPIEARDLGAAFQTITTDLRHQYVVAYSPNNFIPNGQYHTIEVKVLVKGLLARPRKGYYASAKGAAATGGGF